MDFSCQTATSKADRGLAEELTDSVVDKLVEQGFTSSSTPTVEDIQDIVESTLIDSGNSDIAKAYIVYRHERRKLRDEKRKSSSAETFNENPKPITKTNAIAIIITSFIF